MIYFISDGEYTKIGYTKEESIGLYMNRLKQLQTANPKKLEIVGLIMKKDSSFEKRLHKGFSKYHVRGEWFDLSQYDLDGFLNRLYEKDYDAYTKRDLIEYEQEELNFMAENIDKIRSK